MKNDENNNIKEVVKPFNNGRISYDESDTQTPFVNEECGDTMWDAVLEQEEKRAELKSILLGKTDSGSK
jgi:hypothetical protein